MFLFFIAPNTFCIQQAFFLIPDIQYKTRNEQRSKPITSLVFLLIVVWVMDIWTFPKVPSLSMYRLEARRQLRGSLIWISRDFVSFLTLYLWLKLMAAEIFWSFRFHVCGKVPFLGQNWMSTNCSFGQSRQPSIYKNFPTASCSSIQFSLSG